MKWQVKAGIIGGVLLLIMGLAFVVKYQYDKIQELKATTTKVVEQKDIGNGITRSESKQLTRKELEKLIKEKYPDLALIKKDMRENGAKMKGFHTVSIVTPGLEETNLPSTDSTPSTDPKAPKPGDSVIDRYGYFGSTQWIELKEPFSDGTKVPYGRAGFSAAQENPWSLEVTSREYSATTVIGEDKEGRRIAYSRVTITADGETYTVPISENKLVEEYPKAKFRFNPKLNLGVQFGAVANPPAHAEVTPNVDITLFSFGKSKENPSWTFLGVGAGYATQTQAPVLTVAPVRYNVGEPLPLMNNLHLGPSVSLDVDGNIGIYIGIAVGL